MIRETYYTVIVKKHTTGEREQSSFERVYDSEHPKMKEPNPPEQYQYRQVIKLFNDAVTVLEQRLESVDIERVLKALNRGL